MKNTLKSVMFGFQTLLFFSNIKIAKSQNYVEFQVW